MNTPVRQIAVEFFVGVAACGAAYLFLVQPLDRRVAEVADKVVSLQAQIERDTRQAATKAQVDALLTEAAARAKAVRESSAFATDANATFGSLMALASRHGVRVEQLQPGTARAIKAKGGATPDPAAPPSKDRRSAVSMTVIGEFGRVVALVRALEREMGFTSVRSVRLTPMMDGETQRVHASIESEHVWIDTGVENRP